MYVKKGGNQLILAQPKKYKINNCFSSVKLSEGYYFIYCKIYIELAKDMYE